MITKRGVFLVGVALTVAWEAHALFSPAAHIGAAGRKRYVIADFARGVPIGQTFVMPTDGLDAVDVRFFTDEATLLSLRCRLLESFGDSINHWSPVYDWTASVRLPRGFSWHRFTFKPVVPSINQAYQFQLEQIDARTASPRDLGRPPSVAIMGSFDDSLKDGNITIGREQIIDRDLFFEAHAADSVFAEFRRHANPPLPKPLRSAVLQLAVLASYNCLLAVFAFHMLIGEPKENEES